MKTYELYVMTFNPYSKYEIYFVCEIFVLKVQICHSKALKLIGD